MRISGRRRGHAALGKAALLTRHKAQHAAGMRAAADADLPFLHADLAMPAVLAHAEARRHRLDIAQARAHHERARVGRGVRHRVHGDLARTQPHQAGRGVKRHVHGTGRIQMQGGAVGKRHVAPLARAAAVVGGPSQGIGAPGGPAHGAGHHQRHQRLQGARRCCSSGRFRVAMPSAAGIRPKRSFTRCARCQAYSCSALLARH
ncbi:hypothetical protein G6F31_013530 [Rhizopus arrhizus]|nr:hypothetical protein G6F31_013530 [Rhizopus arrhizus]